MNIKFHSLTESREAKYIIVPNFVKSRQSVAGYHDFLFFKMVAAAILDFRNSQILLADEFWRAKTHHHAKFHQNPSIHCGVIVIFYFSRWQPLQSSIFKILNFYWQILFGGSRCITLPNFIKIGQIVFEIL